ncbi:hypothetical protein L0F81_17300 [Streptomyces tricolor]|uniref:Secreted protein n=1 Tax=Streptomyces tricolor TaxID=68277 RepID=A0ABS9JHJ5_9ACTN|nr:MULTISPECIES: hypothetical protein [Streptomyces]MCG0065031.1 hypothetical protein [Streptomyces tricolor]
MLFSSSLGVVLDYWSAEPVADVPAAGPPSVVRAVEPLAVRAFPERFPVVRAGDRSGFSLGSGFFDGVSDDVEVLAPADTSSPPSTSAASPATLAPPWRVIFGMLSSTSTGTLAWIPSAAAEPCSA